MTPIQQQRFNTVVGGVGIGVGVIAWAIALFFAVVPNDKAPAPVTMAPVVDLNSCKSALSQVGFQAELRANAEVVLMQDLATSGEGVKEQLQMASLASTLCKIPMHTFCMGEGCEAGAGMHMTLRPTNIGPRRGLPPGGPAIPSAAKPAPATAAKK